MLLQNPVTAQKKQSCHSLGPPITGIRIRDGCSVSCKVAGKDLLVQCQRLVLGMWNAFLDLLTIFLKFKITPPKFTYIQHSPHSPLAFISHFKFSIRIQ